MEGDIERRGPLPCPRPWFPGKETGGDFLNTSIVFGEGESNKLAGVERGQSPVVPFCRGGEGDNTFNGFVLSSVYYSPKSLIWKMTSWLSYKTLHTKYVRSLYCWCSSSSLSIGRHHSSLISQEPPIFSEKLLQNDLFHHKETSLFSLYTASSVWYWRLLS